MSLLNTPFDGLSVGRSQASDPRETGSVGVVRF